MCPPSAPRRACAGAPFVPALGLVVALVLAAGVPSRAAVEGVPIPHPAGSDELVLRLEVQIYGPPALQRLHYLPRVALYGDGRVVFAPWPPRSAPRSSLPAARTLRLSEAGVQAVLRAARDAGLLGGDRHYPYPCFFPAADTVFTAVADGTTSVVSAYALGGEDTEMACDTDKADHAARAALLRLRDRLLTLPDWLPPEDILEPDGPYLGERLQVLTAPADRLPAGPAVPWPLATPLAAFGRVFPNGEGFLLSEGARCVVVAGDDARRLVAALGGADTSARWASAGGVFTVGARPLLPDESGCAAGATEAPPPPTVAGRRVSGLDALLMLLAPPVAVVVLGRLALRFDPAAPDHAGRRAEGARTATGEPGPLRLDLVVRSPDTSWLGPPKRAGLSGRREAIADQGGSVD